MHTRYFLFLTFIITFFGIFMAYKASYKPQAHGDIIIIWAGISWLSAAQELEKQGIKALILEAKDRIGGRIYTDTLGSNIPVDLWASWIHGTTNNPIKSIADSEGIQTINTNYEDIKNYTNGRTLGRYELWGLWEDFQEYFYEKIESLASEKQDISVWDILSEYAVREKLNQDEVNYLRDMGTIEFSHDAWADISKISAFSYRDENYFKWQEHIIPSGYSRIVEALAKGKDIKLSSRVSRIDYSGSGVIVTLDSGISYKAKKVIVTVPLGVLKAKKILFTPELPLSKQQAINTLAMSSFNKIFLLYNEPFWDREVGFIWFFWGKIEWWIEAMNLFKYTQKPVLMFIMAGDFATKTQKLSDKEIISSIQVKLWEVYGSGVTEPLDYKITRFDDDKDILWSYSYLPVWAPRTLYKDMAQSIDNKVFFAGEATNFEYPSTVHGAYLSGIKAAQKIVK
jgi:monoamine oxidase